MKIRRINLPPEELRKLAAEERSLFFLVGHINNEVSSLYKTFSWCLASAHEPCATQIEENAANAQGMIYARLLAGKLLEAWGALEKSWFASKLGQEMAKSLHPSALASLDKLKRYFGSKNLIFAVRNSFAFHYDAAVLEKTWERASQEQFFDLMIGISRGNSFHQAAELVVNVAVFNTIAPDDVQTGMAKFFKDLHVIVGHFQNYCDGVTRAVLERLSGMNLDQLGSLSEIEPARKPSEVFIPVFTKAEEDVDGELP